MNRVYGWKPDKPEVVAAAPKLFLHARSLAAVPDTVDLRPLFPECYNQGEEGSCSANMTAGMVQYDQKVQGLDLVMPSRQFDYYNSRLMEGTTNQDAGASIGDAVKALVKYGWCPETMWPYTPDRLTAQPPKECYEAAGVNKITDFGMVQQSLPYLQATLAAGHPIGFGFIVYPSFESQQVAKTGIMPMPSFADVRKGPLGGHAVLLVGYINSKQVFLVRNSWGTWGLNGYFEMPYSYVLNRRLSSSFWIIGTIPGAKLDFSII